MTKEELKQEAEKYGIDNYEQCVYDDVIGWETDYKARVQAYIDGAEPREKRIAELEKENAELNTRVENQKSFLERIRAKFELGEIDRKELEGYLESDQLTKAKEIIKLLLWDLRNRSYEPIKDVERAEQFISEVENA